MSAQAHIDLLGKKAKDKVTGFKGVVSSVSFDLYGCIQVALSPPVDEKGVMPDGRWLDVHRLELEDGERCMPVPAFTAKPGTFGQTPQSHSHGPAEKPAR